MLFVKNNIHIYIYLLLCFNINLLLVTVNRKIFTIKCAYLYNSYVQLYVCELIKFKEN